LPSQLLIVDSRTREIENIRSWSCASNLNLNLKKSSEILCGQLAAAPNLVTSLLEGIPRVCSLKILEITIINTHFSVSEHVSCIIGKCAQTIQALRILRSHGLCNDALHLVYRSTVIGKLLYAVNASADRQRMEALVKRGVRSGLCAADTPNLTELIESSDNALFNRVLGNQDHILFPVLPDERFYL